MLPIFVATLAPIASSIQLLPQLHKTYTTKSVTDLSFYTLILIVTTNLLWFLHGYFRFDSSLLIAGIVGLVISLSLLKFFFMYR